MSFTFRGDASAVASAATEIDCNRPTGVQPGDIIIALYAFESVASGSGPWIIPNTGQFSSSYIGPSQSWQQVCFQAPSAAGVGIEVWAAIHGTGSVQDAMFVASQNAVAVTAAWSGEYNPTGTISGGAIRVATTSTVTGNAPPAPSVDANSGELIIACGGDLMSGGGFGTPSGFTSRIDVARAGAGTAEATLADAVTTTATPTGLITFPNAAATSTTRGATATLAIRPVPATAGGGAILDAPMPPDLDIAGVYTFRFTALDPNTGAVITGVNVSGARILCDVVSGEVGGGGTAGPYMLVPGPDA